MNKYSKVWNQEYTLNICLLWLIERKPNYFSRNIGCELCSLSGSHLVLADSCSLLVCFQDIYSPVASPLTPVAAWWRWWMYLVYGLNVFIWHLLDVYYFIRNIFFSKGKIFSTLMLHFKKASVTGKLNSEEFVRLWNKVNSYKVTNANANFSNLTTATFISATRERIFLSSTRKFSSSPMCLGPGCCHWVNSGMHLKCQVEWLQQTLFKMCWFAWSQTPERPNQSVLNLVSI